jgi:hypothetical protein
LKKHIRRRGLALLIGVNLSKKGQLDVISKYCFRCDR